ncbi:hypothetical protein DSM112329_03084 [Paraconexibacter sp. AEG42_29]|uniref:Glycosyltransferase RgtA/B/C/D-like domain-containing protein n=1 Tax=Paraconexibacter sp. AEG42_29 TaxID=2997339 RepID=A0AAU7AX80_9ACTN
MVVFYAALYALAPTDRPVIIADSPGYLAVGRWLTGAGEIPQQLSPFYSWFYGAVFAVPYSITPDLDVAYAFGVALNCVTGGVLFVLLDRIVRRAFPDLAPRLATVLAISGACWAGVSIQVGQIWPEIVLAAMVAGWTLAILRLGAGAARAPLELSLITVVMFATHHRMAGAILVAGALLASHARRTGLRQVVAPFLVLAGGLALTLLVDRVVKDALYPRGAADVPFRLALDAPDLVLQVLIGELWATAAATGGLIALARSFPRERSMVLPALGAAFVLTALLGAAQLGAALEAGAAFRGDFFAYGRYVSPFVPVLVVLGAARLVTSRRWSVAGVAPAAVIIASALQLTVNGTTLGGFTVPLQVSGLLGMGIFGVPLDLVRPSLLACGFAVALAVLTDRVRPGMLAGTIAAVTLLVAAGGAERISNYLGRADDGGDHIVSFLDTLPSDVPVYVDPSTGSGTFELLQMMRPARRFRAQAADARSPMAYVVHGQLWSPPPRAEVTTVSDVGAFQVLSCVGDQCPRPTR